MTDVGATGKAVAVFAEQYPSLDSYWRSVILFGQNVSSYKFALGKALLELCDRESTFIRLEDLAEPFARHLIEHLRGGRKQTTSRSSRFLEACRRHMDGSLSKEELIAATVRLGFNNVIDAFHIVNRAEVPVRFFTDERKGKAGGIGLCDEIFRLSETFQASSLPHEVEARWRLVETAWDLNVSRNLIVVDYDAAGEALFTQDRSLRRVNVTSSRAALNGYQKGKCFYCFSDISIIETSVGATDVDHFFPHVLKQAQVPFHVDGVWNLVLACRTCNRGVAGKSSRVPKLRYLERLYKRNEFLIDSHHPLRETLMCQTGATTEGRKGFLGTAYREAKNALIHDWEPTAENPPAF